MLHSDQKTTCSCYDRVLCLDSRQTSWMMTGIIVLCFGFFMVGYFLGKRKVIQDMCVQLEQDSLADKIYTSLCTMQDTKAVIVQQDKEELEMVDTAPTHETPHAVTSDSMVQAAIEMPIPESDQLTQVVTLQDVVVAQEVDVPNKKYYAELVGFGTRQAAEKCLHRLQHNKMPVMIKQRQSKTAKGKKITWYQLITKELTDKQELEKLVEAIKVKERLKDVRIVSC